MRQLSLAMLAALAATGPASARAQDEGGGGGSDARVSAALGQMDAEPTIIEVHRAALRYFRVTPDVVERLREASVRRAGAPTLTVSGRYERITSARDVTDPNLAINTDDSFGSDLFGGTLELRWDLPGAVFNPAQLQTYALVGIQMNLLKEVTRLYFVRRQLLLSLLTEPPADPRARAALEMRVEEFTSLIDSFTGGWFSESIEESAPRSRR
jgi:hypothetical protein